MFSTKYWMNLVILWRVGGYSIKKLNTSSQLQTTTILDRPNIIQQSKGGMVFFFTDMQYKNWAKQCHFWKDGHGRYHIAYDLLVLQYNLRPQHFGASKIIMEDMDENLT